MAHCNFSFLMELYKAWGGTNQGVWVNPGGKHTRYPMSELKALPHNLEEELDLKGRGQQCIMTMNTGSGI